MVSVIVPVYNAEKTLHRCLDSLIHQTMKDLEIICIDDGSTDHSGEICEDFAKNDARIKVFHKKNEGVSATRQFGIDHASGEYVIHLDADDYVERNAYEKLYSAAYASDADIAICDATQVLEDKCEYMDYSLTEYSTREMIRDLISSFGSVWNRMIRRAIIKEFNVSFPDYLQYGEDKVFLIRLLCRAEQAGRQLRVCHVHEPLIIYDTSSNTESLTKQSRDIIIRNRMKMLEIMGEDLDLTIFGKPFFEHACKQAYSVLQHITSYGFSEAEYDAVFHPFRQGILKKAPFTLKKILVDIALYKGYETALRNRWILAPLIIRDKIVNYFRTN